jgi:hypothetical protein
MADVHNLRGYGCGFCGKAHGHAVDAAMCCPGGANPTVPPDNGAQRTRPGRRGGTLVDTTVHGHCLKSGRTPTYHVWQSMRARCHQPGHKFYARYGGRGITICARWDTFANFLADMGERPDGLSLDRINNDGPYSPENCRWATASQQNSNQARRGTRYELNGESRTLTEWAAHIGMRRATLLNRIEAGWPFDEAISTPVSLANHARRRPPPV